MLSHVTLGVNDIEASVVFHDALEQGATDEGAPGIRAENHPNFYTAYILDLTGNKLLAVCHAAA